MYRHMSNVSVECSPTMHYSCRSYDCVISLSKGWLEPLIAPIVKDNRVITYPVADDIDFKSFQLKMPSGVIPGGFDIRTLTFTWSFNKKTNFTANNIETLSPTMPGGLFAVSRDWFRKLGKFDPGLIIWGTENLEMSFKVWMCGGKVVQTTCSHIGHVFRTFNPYINSYMDIQQNAIRVAEVWMDEYKHYLYEQRGYNIVCETKRTAYGDVSDRVRLRKSLKCNSFDWYINNVYPELKVNLPKHDEVYFGLLKNPKLNLCLVPDNSQNSTLGPCDDLDLKQLWKMTTEGYLDLSRDTLMPDIWAPQTEERTRVVRRFIGGVPSWKEKLIWKYDGANNRLVNSDTGQCLEADLSTNTTVLAKCQEGSILQNWTLTTRRERMVILRDERHVPIDWSDESSLD
ncbi:Polypeptide N-acetylgalactosaminyltransferase 4 [Bulinus truncatus]|nr:Polypeptide N-acetylgalactosaminyltransferase 4 [Bulinus truncatus]